MGIISLEGHFADFQGVHILLLGRVAYIIRLLYIDQPSDIYTLNCMNGRRPAILIKNFQRIRIEICKSNNQRFHSVDTKLDRYNVHSWG